MKTATLTKTQERVLDQIHLALIHVTCKNPCGLWGLYVTDTGKGYAVKGIHKATLNALVKAGKAKWRRIDYHQLNIHYVLESVLD